MNNAEAKYEVIERNGCYIIYGAFPIEIMARLSKKLPHGAIMDTHVARLLGATLAAGTVEGLKEISEDEDVRRTAYLRAAQQIGDLKIFEEAIKWYAWGHHGQSSLALFHYTMGMREADACQAYPHDVADFMRCREVVDSVTEVRERLDKMKHVSTVWDSLISRWNEICLLIDEETADGGSAKKAYEIIKEIGRTV